jgi:ABC-type uncharacterized transport system auxiliary subunit
MKKLVAILAISASLSACHYGTEEAQKTLDANEQYKSEKADYSVNRANVSATEEVAVADTVKAAADTVTVK